jgi:hypothetical protein
LLAGLATSAPAISAAAPVDPQNQPIIFKVPDGVMAGDFAGEKRPGMFMLYPDKPAGIYVTYSKDGETFDAFIATMKAMAVNMFLHDEKATLTWSSAVLPKHEKVENETGTTFYTTSGDYELQLVEYTRMMGTTTIYYGYFGMRHVQKKKDDAQFMDSEGKGVSKFDKFWKTISDGKK